MRGCCACRGGIKLQVPRCELDAATLLKYRVYSGCDLGGKSPCVPPAHESLRGEKLILLKLLLLLLSAFFQFALDDGLRGVSGGKATGGGHIRSKT